MGGLIVIVEDVGGIARRHSGWMSWNLLLALLPALLAVPLFRLRRRGLLWGVGLVAFLLLLPNAPYVVTDLVHLRGDMLEVQREVAVYAGLLPIYALFIAAGLVCYVACLREVGASLRRTGHERLVGPAELGLHALCAVGVLLGRVARLNSWDTLTRPADTAARAFDTLSWPGSPLLVAVLFAVIWLGHAATRVLASAGAHWVTGHLPHLPPGRGRAASA